MQNKNKISCRLAVANQKGGVGKTTVSLGVAGVLSEIGKKILLVDMDHQGNLSSVFVENINILNLTVYDLLTEDSVDVSDVIKKTTFENIDVLPANLSLGNLDANLAGVDDSQYYLLEELQDVENDYDYIIIDCPPSLGKATRMALVAAQGIIVPIECQEWAVKGSSQLESYIKNIHQRANPKLKILGFVINKFDPRRAIESTYNQVLRKAYPHKIFRTELHNNVPYTEAATARQPINYYSPKSKQADDYRKLVKEILASVKKNKTS